MKKIINLLKNRFYRNKFNIGLLNKKKKYYSVDSLISEHFKDNPEHPCIVTLKKAQSIDLTTGI